MSTQNQTITKAEEKIRDQLLELVPNTEFKEMKRIKCDLYVFKSIKGKAYKCIACDKKHKKCGWYAFEKQSKIMAGCYHGAFKKSGGECKCVIKLDGYESETEQSDFESDSESDEDIQTNYGSVMDALSDDDDEPIVATKIKKEKKFEPRLVKIKAQPKIDIKALIKVKPQEKKVEEVVESDSEEEKDDRTFDERMAEDLMDCRPAKRKLVLKYCKEHVDKMTKDKCKRLNGEELKFYAKYHQDAGSELEKNKNKRKIEKVESDSESEEEEEIKPKKKIEVKLHKSKVGLFKKDKKDLPPEENPEIDYPFSIYYLLKKEELQTIKEELQDDELPITVSKYGLTFYDALFKANYYNRSDPDGDSFSSELDFMIAEQKSMIKLTINGKWAFACAGSTDILKIINHEDYKKGALELHEYPRYNPSLFFDLDDKDMYAYKDQNDMYKDIVLANKLVFDKVRKIKGSNKEFIKEFDPSKLIIHADDMGLNSLHVIYDNDGKVFHNTAVLEQFMEYFIKVVVDYSEKEKTFSEETNKITEAMKRVKKVLDLKVYGSRHSIRTIGSIKKEEKYKWKPRKFLRVKWDEETQKLIVCKNQKVTEKDIVTKGSSNEYCMKIPHNAINKHKKFYQPTDQSQANGLAEKFQSYAKETVLATEVNNLFGFNCIRGYPYNCPACGTEHTSNGWYGFMKGNKGYAGCHGTEYKNSKMGPRYLFSLDTKECEDNIKNWKETNNRNLIREIIEDIEKNGLSKGENGKTRKWSFSDYLLFVRSKEPTPIRDIIEYLHETVIHVIDCGANRLFTKSHLNDGSIGIKQVPNVFYKINNVYVDAVVNGKTESIDLYKTYHGFFYNYCSHSFIDFIPYLDKKDGALLLDKKFKNTFNLFQGFKHEYEKMDCEKIRNEKKLELIFDHIDVLANHDKKVSEYILKWIAHIVQYPRIKNKVGLAFYSKKEQAGKNIFWNWIAEEIFGENLSRSVNSIDSLTQRFNKASEGKLFTIGNEVTSYAKHRNCEKLRSLLTEILQEIEAKNFESITIHDYCAYVFLTNNFNFMRIKTGDKRYCPSQMDETKIGKFDYFDKLAKCMEDNAYLFFNYLANIDLSDFRVADAPMTDMKKQLIEDNLAPPLKFIQHLVDMDEEDMYEHLGMDTYENDSDDEDADVHVSKCIIKNHKRITKKDFYTHYKTWYADEGGEFSHKGKTEFFRELTENGIIASKATLTGQKGRPWHIGIKFEDLKAISDTFTE